MGILYSLLSMAALIFIVLIGAGVLELHFLFGVAIPSAAFIVLLAGVVYRVIGWARSPVPFCIPTVCGQGKSLPWIKANKTESPFTTGKGTFFKK